jgi:hypothetical protein
MGRSRGTLPFQLAGNIQHGGLVEKAFGLTLRELMFDFGGGSAIGRPIKAVQVGGPLGAYVPESQWDLPLDYEAYAAVGAVVGHGGIVVHDDTADMSQAGALRDGVLRDRVLRQVHALPHRLDARRRGDRPHRPQRRTGRSRSCCCATCATRCSTAACARWAA